MSTVARSCALLLTSALLSMAEAASPPVAPVKDVVETLHGVVVHDPYRYMEDVKAPAVQDWLRGQAAYARETLDRIDQRDAIEQRITALTAASGDLLRDIVRMPGDRIYYLKRPAGARQFQLVMRQGLAGEEQVLVDPEAESKRSGVPHAINYFAPSWDGRYIAYGMSAGGSEDAALYILDIAKNKNIGEPVPRVHETPVSWLPDSKSLTFNQLKPPTAGEPASETYLDSRVLWLRVGDKASEAKPVFGPTVSTGLGLARLDVATMSFAPGSRWAIARTTDTTLPEGLLFAAPLADLGKPSIRWQRIAGYADLLVDLELRGDDLYLLSRAKAPRKQVLKLDLRQPDLKRAVEVAVAPVGGVLEQFVLTRDALIASVRIGTDVVLRRYKPGDRLGEPIAMPFKGAALLHADPAHAYGDVLYTLAGWTQLPRSFLLSGANSVDARLQGGTPPAGLPELEVVDVEVASHDGARVPLTLLHKKGLQRDGSNPTLLYGYGAYGFSIGARYSPAWLAWIERGGVLALANVRGSGVRGDDWYRAGFKASKANTWKDGLACARWLIAHKIASPKTLAVMGTSAGGIFVGRAVTTSPELFAAAVFDVGIMDTVRVEESANGITNISEFGSTKNAAEFPALLEMSSYHQIKDGTAYPAVLLVHGMNDPRVDVWQSAKAAARLQAASSSGKPVLLRLDLQAGHGVGSTATQAIALAADIYGFLLWQMGQLGLKN
ncbi:prolyl oligopeptidase family serine peptidase [Roseateles violae]|uniref:prolyl oligopeptidase n=1 Tax=Roseateles violae TaxID=3058042 RepID=A0ABT8DZF4_9BURK|nr:prolyl oligopeptidase family serine peptidase [Pelomonas sp. PFR6]MDN3922981.1 prolyl oligopeptidase family serine peptidase [Pelomonas sp. PFR6]